MKYLNVAKRYGSKLAVATGTAFASPLVFAQTTISTAPVTDFLEDQVIVGIAAIGGIMLLVAVVFAGYRWVRGAAGGN